MPRKKFVRQQTSDDQLCTACRSENLAVMTKWRYVWFMSTLPVLVTVGIGLLVEPIFSLFAPAIVLTNYMLAKKKTPLKICKNCKHIQKPNQPRSKKHEQSAV
ncbi:hypothetical protein [Shouchella shacheensis]|uniref:hypothetical protein n=1 Tax=Shouchella shacheensis TaxID=1649580 RepID=UPI0007402323|nr:hypothetical protein [Shouchella shacheensis]